jgi:hypothetical protein
VQRFGEELALGLLPIVTQLANEFYESDASQTAPDLVAMGDLASARFRALHPELSIEAIEAIEALAWCYTYDFK